MRTVKNDIILHIPHSSNHLPSYDGYLLGMNVLKEEINLVTDWYTDELFDLPYKKIIAPFSRIFCDVERFPDDSEEVMSKSGMGLCYTHTDAGRIMRIVSPELKRKIKSEYYDRHHNLLEQSVSQILSRNKKAVIIDCHSFPNIPLVRDLNKEVPRPDFCIGTDDYHTPESLKNNVRDFLTDNGFSVKYNNPYSGTMIPLKFLNKEKKVIGLMIEINRKLYRDIKSDVIIKSTDFPYIKNLIKKLIITTLNF